MNLIDHILRLGSTSKDLQAGNDDQRRAMFARMADDTNSRVSRALSSHHPAVRRALTHGVTDIGQLSADDKHALAGAVKHGVLMKTQDYKYPNAKPMFVGHPDYIRGVLEGKPTTKAVALGAQCPMMVTKAADGSYRWTLISSNPFEDRDREIISHKALGDDVTRADGDGDYGPLRWWHVPGAELGDCTFNAMHGKMLVEAGTFRNPQVAEAIKAHAAELGVSIGFTHPKTEPDGSGVFHHIRRFERSLLPREVASNPLTAIPIVTKENTMLKEKADALRKVLGGDDALVKQVLDLAESTEKAAEASGTRFKELGDAAKVGETFESDGETFVKTAAGHILTVKAKAPAKPPAKPEADAADAAEDAADGGDDEAAEGEKKTKALATAIQAAIEPGLAALRTEFKQLLDQAATTKAEAEAESLKSVNDKLTRMAADIQKASDGVAELKGEQPRGHKAWRASQDGPEPPAHARQAEPAEDVAAQAVWDKHFKAIQTAAGVQSAQPNA